LVGVAAERRVVDKRASRQLSKENSRMKLSQFAARKLLLFPLIPSMMILAGWANETWASSSFTVTPLVTNDQAANPAQITDSQLVNAWGISFAASSPFWVSDNGTGHATLYNVNPITNVTTAQGLVVSIPGDGSVTGQVFNSTSGFNGDRFLFVSEDGTISGWRGVPNTTAEVLQLPSDANYKGAALATISGNSYLYAANFHSGKIDVLKGTAGAPDLMGSFTDPAIPNGYAPFNIQSLGGKIYVTYALQGSGKDEQAGLGFGFVSVFDTQGIFLRRVASQGTMNAPWGLAIAPASFGSLAGDLLVGNFGDGTINAFNLSTDTFVGQLKGTNGQPLVIDGLWGLTPGNDSAAGNSNSIYFSAGPQDESNGLFGVITAVPEPSSMVLALIAVALVIASRRFNRSAVSMFECEIATFP
jgi:uncharacterized protein (TIGR03118 family)